MTQTFYGIGYRLSDKTFNVLEAGYTKEQAKEAIKKESDPDLCLLKIVATYSRHKLVSETITEI